MSALTFAAVLPALLVAHTVGDHWFQTHHQATRKHLPGWTGRLACARHVGTYTALTAATVLLLWWALDLEISPAGFVLGQLVSAVTHYWADRRAPLERLANGGPFGRIGRGGFYRLGQPRPVLIATTDDGRAVTLRTATGASAEWDNPTLGTGAYALDQSWHWASLFVAALLTAVI